MTTQRTEPEHDRAPTHERTRGVSFGPSSRTDHVRTAHGSMVPSVVRTNAVKRPLVGLAAVHLGSGRALR